MGCLPVSLMDIIHEAAASSGLSSTGTATGRVVRNIIMTRDANELIAGLAQETGLKKGW
jgi:hypothetical protein